MKKPERLDIGADELAGILERVRASLTEDEFAKLKAAIETLAWLTDELEHKRVSIARLKKLLFGATTEKTSQVLEQVLGATTADLGPKGEGEAIGEGVPVAREKRPGHGRQGADAYRAADRVRVSHPALSPKAPCPGCGKGKVYRLAQPHVLVRVRGQAPLAATVYELEALRCNLCGEVYTAPAPEGVGEEKYDETAAAMIGLLKYGSGVPFHRQERLGWNLGIPLPAATQWDIVQETADRIAPAYQELVREAAQGEVLYNDDTTMRILDLMGKRGRRRALEEGEAPVGRAVFTSGIVSTAAGRRMALFFTGPRHAGENLRTLLNSRASDLAQPIQMCDALSRNLPGELATIVAHCLAHGRRRFVDVAENFPEACRHVLETLRVVYENDAVARRDGMSPDDRLAHHRAKSGPLMEDLRAWFAAQFGEKRVEPHSGLGEAISYMLRHWEALTRFLAVPGAPLDNNICERALKKAIQHRNNALFYKTENGARVGDTFMSLIYTAELSGANPFDYLTVLQRHADQVRQDPARWMPWNYEAARAALGDARPPPP